MGRCLINVDKKEEGGEHGGCQRTFRVVDVPLLGSDGMDRQELGPNKHI